MVTSSCGCKEYFEDEDEEQLYARPHRGPIVIEEPFLCDPMPVPFRAPPIQEPRPAHLSNPPTGSSQVIITRPFGANMNMGPVPMVGLNPPPVVGTGGFAGLQIPAGPPIAIPATGNIAMPAMPPQIYQPGFPPGGGIPPVGLPPAPTPPGGMPAMAMPQAPPPPMPGWGQGPAGGPAPMHGGIGGGIPAINPPQQMMQMPQPVHQMPQPGPQGQIPPVLAPPGGAMMMPPGNNMVGGGAPPIFQQVGGYRHN